MLIMASLVLFTVILILYSLNYNTTFYDRKIDDEQQLKYLREYKDSVAK